MHMAGRRKRAKTVGMEMVRGRRKSISRERQIPSKNSKRITAEAMLSLRHL